MICTYVRTYVRRLKIQIRQEGVHSTNFGILIRRTSKEVHTLVIMTYIRKYDYTNAFTIIYQLVHHTIPTHTDHRKKPKT